MTRTSRLLALALALPLLLFAAVLPAAATPVVQDWYYGAEITVVASGPGSEGLTIHVDYAVYVPGYPISDKAGTLSFANGEKQNVAPVAGLSDAIQHLYSTGAVLQIVNVYTASSSPVKIVSYSLVGQRVMYDPDNGFSILISGAAPRVKLVATTAPRSTAPTASLTIQARASGPAAGSALAYPGARYRIWYTAQGVGSVIDVPIGGTVTLPAMPVGTEVHINWFEAYAGPGVVFAGRDVWTAGTTRTPLARLIVSAGGTTVTVSREAHSVP